MSITPRPPQIIPYLVYRDAPAALDFLTRAFGFKEEMRAGAPSGRTCWVNDPEGHPWFFTHPPKAG